jgi:hypothetical protein
MLTKPNRMWVAKRWSTSLTGDVEADAMAEHVSHCRQLLHLASQSTFCAVDLVNCEP